MRRPSRIESFSAGIVLSGGLVFGVSAYQENQAAHEIETIAAEFGGDANQGLQESLDGNISDHEGVRNFFLGMLAVDGLMAAGYIGLEVAGRRFDRRHAN